MARTFFFKIFLNFVAKVTLDFVSQIKSISYKLKRKLIAFKTKAILPVLLLKFFFWVFGQIIFKSVALTYYARLFLKLYLYTIFSRFWYFKKKYCNTHCARSWKKYCLYERQLLWWILTRENALDFIQAQKYFFLTHLFFKL